MTFFDNSESNEIPEILKKIGELLVDWGLTPKEAGVYQLPAFLMVVVVLGVITNFIAKKLILRVLGYVVKKTKNSWDDILLEKNVFNRLSHIAPALIIYGAALLLFAEDESRPLAIFMKRGSLVYMVVVTLWVIDACLTAFQEIYRRYEVSKSRPIKGYIQATKIIVILCGLVLIVSVIVNKSPIVFFSGLGAVTAIVVLVFKDAILGFVASIQLSSNNMVQPGDWISMPKYGADGDVIDVSLTTVKVQNWDKTITSIPIYALISDSFTNWRGMSESGGRRITKSIHIDMSTIRFADEKMMEGFSRFSLLTNYLNKKREEIDAWHKEQNIEESDYFKRRRLTNLGTFRAYLLEYLRANDKIHQDMTLMVRLMEPNQYGVPMQIYCFSKDQKWENYEGIQGDLLDHALAILPEFGLRAYQQPSSADLEELGEALGKVLGPGPSAADHKESARANSVEPMASNEENPEEHADPRTLKKKTPPKGKVKGGDNPSATAVRGHGPGAPGDDNEGEADGDGDSG